MNLLAQKNSFKLVAKTLKKMGKFFSLKPYRNQLKRGVFIPSQNSAHLQPGKGRNALLVDCLVDRPTVIFMTVVPPVDK